MRPSSRLGFNARNMHFRTLTFAALVAAGAAAQGSVVCPGSNSTQYVSSNGATFLVECGIDHAGGDLSSASASTFEACIDLCAANSQCVDVSYSGTACYLKNVYKPPVSNANVNAAKLISSTTGAATPTTSVTGATTSATSAATSASMPLSCPSANGTAYGSNGLTFNIECSLDHAGGDLSGANTGTFDACIALCSATATCVDVSFAPASGMCYLKSTLNAAVANSGVWGARVGALSCPNNNATTYNINGTLFSLECYIDRAGGDFKQVTASSLENCMNICSTTASCVDVSYVPGGGNCYMKSRQVAPSSNNNVWGARVIGVISTSTSSTTTSQTTTPSTTTAQATTLSTMTVSSSTTATTNATPGSVAPSASTVTVVSTSVSTSTVTSVSTSVSTSVYTSTATASSCATTATATGSSGVSTFQTCQKSISGGSAGCALALPPGQTPGGSSQVVNFTTSSGSQRQYLVYIPSTYSNTNKTALILSYHGASNTMQGQEAITGFSTSSLNPDTIVVYPQGINGYWQGAPYSTVGVDDVAFTTQLLANLSSTYCIDPSRIYASGFSNGGGFVGTLACDPNASLLFAAYGAHSGAFYPNVTYTSTCDPSSVSYQYPSCNPGRQRMPIVEFHGFNDTQIPYAGGAHNGQCLPSLPHWNTAWAARDGYSTTNITTNLGGGNFEYQWGTSSAGVAGVVTHYEVFGLGHQWASNFNGFSASPVMLSFFKQWVLSGP